MLFNGKTQLIVAEFFSDFHNFFENATKNVLHCNNICDIILLQ